MNPVLPMPKYINFRNLTRSLLPDAHFSISCIAIDTHVRQLPSCGERVISAGSTPSDSVFECQRLTEGVSLLPFYSVFCHYA